MEYEVRLTIWAIFQCSTLLKQEIFFRVVGIKIIHFIKLQQSNLLVRISQFFFAFLELKKKFESHNYNENPCTAIQTSSCTIICMLSTMKQWDGQFVYIM